MPKFTYTRLSIIEEEFVVTADTELEALQKVQDGDPSVDILKGEWIDYHSDGYELRDVEDELETWIRKAVQEKPYTA